MCKKTSLSPLYDGHNNISKLQTKVMIFNYLRLKARYQKQTRSLSAVSIRETAVVAKASCFILLLLASFGCSLAIDAAVYLPLPRPSLASSYVTPTLYMSSFTTSMNPLCGLLFLLPDGSISSILCLV